MNTGDAGPQPTAQVQLTLASWHPGGHLTRIEEEMQELGVTTLDDVRRRIADLHRELDEE